MSYTDISRIEIEHVRSLHGLQADLVAPCGVIVGENRSGKSNLLHALRLILDPSLPDSARELRPEDFWDGLPAPYGGESISVHVFLTGFEGDADAECVLADCLVSEDPMVARLTYLCRPKVTRVDAATGTLTEEDYDYVVYGGEARTKRTPSAATCAAGSPLRFCPPCAMQRASSPERGDRRSGRCSIAFAHPSILRWRARSAGTSSWPQ